MKARFVFSIGLLLQFALPAHADARVSYDVELNNKGYEAAVKFALEADRVAFRIVAQAQPGVPVIRVHASHAQGCQARVEIESGFLQVTRSRQQSMGFSSEARRLEKCRRIVADLVRQSLASL